MICSLRVYIAPAEADTTKDARTTIPLVVESTIIYICLLLMSVSYIYACSLASGVRETELVTSEKGLRRSGSSVLVK
ncbi:hypothetical protein BS17DRAFT_313159 [Gyrodon lividus]|nr:hypothetical protein BS17DRAFT_313159 [Gyrodon lividus]